MESTDLKISKLKLTFPEIEDESILLEILIICNGSLKQAESLLLEQFNGDPSKKRKIEESSTSKYQSSIKSFFNGDKRPKTTTKSVVINKSNTKTIKLHTKEDIEEALPYVTFHKNFLPADVANNVLTYLMANKDHLHKKEFYIHGTACKSNHEAGSFTSNDEYLGEETDLVYNGEKLKALGKYNDGMRILQMLVEDKMESEMAARKKISNFQAKSWKGNFAICNHFENKSSTLDWHSDRLSYIGPLPAIASISFGATREFRLRRNHPVKANPHPIYSIPLPHNTLIIMHSGCQEEYKHCVAASPHAIDKHPIANQARFNLTIRNYMSQFYEGSPRCKCDMGMILRRSYKEVSARGKYFWQCNNVYQNKSCGQFYWANFANEDLKTDDEKKCSVWVADDDEEKLEYMRENGIRYDKENGVFIYD